MFLPSGFAPTGSVGKLNVSLCFASSLIINGVMLQHSLRDHNRILNLIKIILYIYYLENFESKRS